MFDKDHLPIAGRTVLRQPVRMAQQQPKRGLRRANVEIGDRLRWIREHAGLSKIEMARSLNCDQSYYGKIEAGERPITLTLAQEIADRADVTMDFLVRGLLRGLHPDVLEALAAGDHGLVIRPGGTDRRTDRDPA